MDRADHDWRVRRSAGGVLAVHGVTVAGLVAWERALAARTIKLRRDRNRDLAGVLAGQLRDSDRTDHAFYQVIGKAARLQPFHELRPFCPRADQAEVRKVGPPQDFLAEREIQGVAVGHHQKGGSGWGTLDGVLRHFGTFESDVRRHFARKLLRATVNPRDPTRQLPKYAHQRLADMASAEEYDVECLGADRLEQKPLRWSASSRRVPAPVSDSSACAALTASACRPASLRTPVTPLALTTNFPGQPSPISVTSTAGSHRSTRACSAACHGSCRTDIGSNRMRTLPPQHCPSDGPSPNRRSCGVEALLASISRARSPPRTQAGRRRWSRRSHPRQPAFWFRPRGGPSLASPPR